MRHLATAWLLVFHLGLLAVAVVQGMALEDLNAFFGSRTSLAWISSLERVATGMIALLISALHWSRPARLFWLVVALAVTASGVDVYFGLARELARIWHLPARTAQDGLLLTSLAVAAVLVAAGTALLRRDAPAARRALLFCVLLGLGSLGLELTSGLPSARRMATRLHTAAYGSGSLASFCLLWATYTFYRARLRSAQGAAAGAMDGGAAVDNKYSR